MENVAEPKSIRIRNINKHKIHEQIKSVFILIPYSIDSYLCLHSDKNVNR